MRDLHGFGQARTIVSSELRPASFKILHDSVRAAEGELERHPMAKN